ncbi:MAG: sugar ABC transporter permease [Caldisericia bacterium]|nr:sugar ABC transporter permease [Caldisericia bacterium]
MWRIYQSLIKNNDKILGIILIIPVIIWILTILIYPFVNIIQLSFTNLKLFGTDANFVGFRTYQRLFQDETFLISIKNSLIFTLVSVFLQIVLGLLTAVLLNENFFGCKFLRTWVITPWVIPYSVVAVIGRWMLSSTFGVINWMLIKTGLISEPIAFLGTINLAMPTVIAINTWKWFPFVSIIYLAAMQGIPEDLYEAARIDGSSGLQEFRYITLPSLIPTMVITTLLMTFWNFNTFGLVWLLTYGGPGTATTTMPISVYIKAFREYRGAEASALSVIMLIILLLYTIIYRKLQPSED